MKKKFLIVVLISGFFISANAQTGILEIIKAGIKKVIVAVDLKIQRLQTNTIWLQNAEKVVENAMSKVKLSEIGDWVQKQKDLYSDYFDELWKIKNTIATYQKVKDIIQKQIQLVNEYSKAFALSKQDQNFTADEIKYMHDVYGGILDESVKNIEQIQLVITAYSTQMSDGKRLEVINTASDAIDQNISDLRQFNQENIKTSLQRAKEKNDVDVVRKLYGL